MPDPWSVDESQDGVVTASGNSITVTVKTSNIDRSTAPNMRIYATGRTPSFSQDWTGVNLTGTTFIRNDIGVEFQYTAVLNGVGQRLFIHWYFRGDRLIEVTVRTNSDSWNDNGVQDDLQDVLTRFMPDGSGAQKTADEVLEALADRFEGIPNSGIIARDEELQGNVELTCTKAVGSYLLTPEYVGPGEWFIRTNSQPHGYNEWTVYEPDMVTVAPEGNASNC